MNVLCPSCHVSIPVSAAEPTVTCERCDLSVPLSQLGTSPGQVPVPVVRDFSGEQVGEYRIDALIGSGGMGVVYRAHRLDENEPVAVKVLHADFRWNRDQFVARFEREAKALHRLVHPNIVRILDHGKAGDVHYIVTELIEGNNLAEHMRDRTLALDEIVDIMTQVCAGIGYAHEHGVVHRDIKPANIFISPDGAVKVLDFGLAQLTGVEHQVTSLTRTNLAMGTFNYLSPEQRTNAKVADARSDIFSLGVIFYELLTGSLPIGSFVLPSETARKHPRACDRVVKRALGPSPDARYQRVEELAAALAALAPRSRKLGRRIAQAAAVAAGVLGVVVAVAGPGVFGGDSAPNAVIEAEAENPALSATEAASEPAAEPAAGADVAVDPAALASVVAATEPALIGSVSAGAPLLPEPLSSKKPPAKTRSKTKISEKKLARKLSKIGSGKKALSKRKRPAGKRKKPRGKGKKPDLLDDLAP